jgi:large subunit ribosomal protein L21
MLAVIETGGKQYSVKAGTRVVVEKLEGAVGDTVVIERVLFAGDKIGTPLVSGAKVSATIIAQGRDDKIIVFKKKRRQNYRRKNGHRQYITTLQINDIAV